MAFAIEIHEVVMGEVPPLVRAGMRVQVRELADRLEEPPLKSRCWEFMSSGSSPLEIEGWLFHYRVDVRRKTVVVQRALALNSERPAILSD